MTYPTYPTPMAPAPAPQPPAPAASTPARRGWFALGFGIATVAFTIVAIALAVLGPMLNAVSGVPAAPSSWTKVYDAVPSSAVDWSDDGGGCAVSQNGLDAQGKDASAGVCLFAPSKARDLLSQGFLLELRIAPAAQIPKAEDVYVRLGESGVIVVKQSGDYLLCNAECLSAARSGESRTVGVEGTFDLHVVAPNTLTLRWAGGDAPLEFYANGQRVNSMSFSLLGSRTTNLWLGAISKSEAVFTHVTLYSAS